VLRRVSNRPTPVGAMAARQNASVGPSAVMRRFAGAAVGCRSIVPVTRSTALMGPIDPLICPLVTVIGLAPPVPTT
jgi:hypothetical protein